ncbi:hypothetical protein GCM10017687_03830 [Streptomyces echinatus]
MCETASNMFSVFSRDRQVRQPDEDAKRQESYRDCHLQFLKSTALLVDRRPYLPPCVTFRSWFVSTAPNKVGPSQNNLRETPSVVRPRADCGRWPRAE